MPTPVECLCCKEVAQVDAKLSELATDSGTIVSCITDHPGFAAVCLNTYVLQAAYFEYRQHYGRYTGTVNE